MHRSHHQRSVSTCGPNSCNGGAQGIGVPKNNAYTFLWESSHFSLNDKGLRVSMDEAVCNHLHIVCIQPTDVWYCALVRFIRAVCVYTRQTACVVPRTHKD